MSSSVSVWLLIVVAIGLANLPFLSQRWLGLWASPLPKTLFHRLLELLACYALTGVLGLMLEQRGGQIAPQRWEFYAITLALFLTLAFPGFVFRYLLKR